LPGVTDILFLYPNPPPAPPAFQLTQLPDPPPPPAPPPTATTDIEVAIAGAIQVYDPEVLYSCDPDVGVAGITELVAVLAGPVPIALIAATVNV
jgi:hypothetical protein